MNKKFFGTLAVILLSYSVNAQNPVLLECMNINKAYIKSSYLSFDVKYKYSFEATPTVIEDSSLGVFKFNGYNYWGMMDSVEFMQNDSFLIAAYMPEKVLSLALPAYNYNKNLPLAQWDSLFFENDRFTSSFSVDAGAKKITVDYDSDLPYKKFEMWYDSVTYRISRIKYVISEFATDPNFYELGDPGDYGIVDIQFTNYQTGMFTNSVFNSANYFYKSGASYIPVSPFTAYEVFLASTGL